MSEASAPEPLRPPSRRAGPLPLAVLMIVFVLVALLKPWSWGAAGGSTAAIAGWPAPTSTGAPASTAADRASAFVGPIPPRDLDYDWGGTAARLAVVGSWTLTPLVAGAVGPGPERGDALPPRVRLVPATSRAISRTTIGLDPRASHGPWVERPPVVVWPEGNATLYALALTAPSGEAPTSLRLWADFDETQLIPLGVRELGSGYPTVRLLLPPIWPGRAASDGWEAGTYRLEMQVGDRLAQLTLVVLPGPPWPY
ncbi:MAG: hypothetical protein ACXVAE_00930 [Candidatus Limnocylindrales bacterium]